MPVGSDGVLHSDVVNQKPVGVGVEFDFTGAIEGEVFNTEVLY